MKEQTTQTPESSQDSPAHSTESSAKPTQETQSTKDTKAQKPGKPLSHKLIVWILGLGGVVILVLALVLVFMTRTLKTTLQDTLNTQLQAMQEAGANISYEPFVCSGFRAITCQSPTITWENLTLKGIQLGVESFSDSGGAIELKSTGINIASLEGLQELTRIDLISMINPSSLQCRLELSSQQTQGDTAAQEHINEHVATTRENTPAPSPVLSHNLSCSAKASNLAYTWGASGYIALDKHMQDSSFPEILHELGSAYISDRAGFLAQTPVFIEHAHLQTTAKDLPQAVVQELAKHKSQAEPSTHTQDTPEATAALTESQADSSKAPESSTEPKISPAHIPNTQETNTQEYDMLYTQFASTIETIKPLALYIALLNLREKEHIALVEFSINALSDMYLGKNSGLSYELTPKAQKPISLESFLYDPFALLRDTTITYQALPAHK